MFSSCVAHCLAYSLSVTMSAASVFACAAASDLAFASVAAFVCARLSVSRRLDAIPCSTLWAHPSKE